jgi:hypothetical protein
MTMDGNENSPKTVPINSGKAHAPDPSAQEKYSKLFVDSAKRIGRKRLVHELDAPEARNYFGFGIVEARETVDRALAQRGNPPEWMAAKAEVTAVLAELPAVSRTRPQAAEAVFQIWVDSMSRWKQEEDHAGIHPFQIISPAAFARGIMKSLLPENEAKDIPNEPPPNAARGPALPIRFLVDGEYEHIQGIYDTGGPIRDAARAGYLLLMMTARGGGDMCRHPDGLVQAIGHLLGDIGRLLMTYDPRRQESEYDHPRDTRAESEKRLRALVRAAEQTGLRVSYGPIRGVPQPDDPAWCARRVRAALAAIDFLDLPAYEDWLAEPAVAEDPKAIAEAFAERWVEFTNRPAPITGPAVVAAIRDLLARLDSEWLGFDRYEKARQVVMVCMRLAGHKKPSAFFDAERKKAERGELRELGAEK